MHTLKFAIVDSNVLAGIGLKQILEDIMPVIDIDIYTSFDALVASEVQYIHIFASSRIYFEHASFFRSNMRHTIVLVTGDMNITGVTTINVCQTEQNIAKTIVALMRQGHKGNTQAPNPTPDNGKTEILSAREIEVAVLLAKSFINKQIADKLNISVTTVISHRKNIMEKIHARSLADITVYCVMNGLIDVADI